MPGEAPDLSFEADPRRRSVLVAIAGIWIGLAALWWVLQVRWWIILPAALLTYPALSDAARGVAARLEITGDRLWWRRTSGREGEVDLTDVVRAGIRIRLDRSRRVRLYLSSGASRAIPPECTPPGDALAEALAARGIEVRREHFG